MGEDIINSLILCKANGEKYIIENVREISIEEDEFNIPNLLAREESLIEEREHSVELKINKITRKRFVKLLMSRGMQKNEAIQFSKFINRKYKTYSQLYLLLADIYLNKRKEQEIEQSR